MSVQVDRIKVFLSSAIALIMLLIPYSSANAKTVKTDDKLIEILQKELKRSFKKLKRKGKYPLYFLAYRVLEDDYISYTGKFGSLTNDSDSTRFRHLQVELRMGDPSLDNSHKLRGSNEYVSHVLFESLPIDDDEYAIRNVIWRTTDKAFKAAQKQLTLVKASKKLKVREQDQSGDFTRESPSVYIGQKDPIIFDKSGWKKKLRNLSDVFNNYPVIRDSSVTFSSERQLSYLVTSEGTVKREQVLSHLVNYYAEAVASDGMVLWLYDRFESPEASGLPNYEALKDNVQDMAIKLTKLTKAPLAEPYVGPAILKGRAAGVFFHEILGHRLEGHRQKDEDEGRTFRNKVGTRIMPAFISVHDDPSIAKMNDVDLSGFYKYDDEGIPSSKVVLVNEGILKGFLMSRTPISGFPKSNGHGRCDNVNAPCARQGNLIVKVKDSKRVSFEKLRKMLKEEVKKQGKPYGLIFDEMSGGSTFTQVAQPQLYKLYPLLVTRVYPDNRPDEMIRGVDIVGTPLASLENILGAGLDLGIFNGVCGAESGNVPVSAISPSLLIEKIEVQRKPKSDDLPPLLPQPGDSKKGI